MTFLSSWDVGDNLSKHSVMLSAANRSFVLPVGFHFYSLINDFGVSNCLYNISYSTC